MAAVTFDPSRQLDLYFRVNRAGSKTLTFSENISANTYQVLIKDYFGNTIKTLTSGAGLTVSGTTIVIAPTADHTNIPPAEYYWELYLTNLGVTWLNGKAFLHTGIFDGVTESTTVTITTSGDDVTVTLSSSPPVATQSEVNTGSETGKYVSPATLQDLDDTAVALVDGATIDLTGPKHTLSTALGRTFTISHAGDGIVLVVTLTATSATMTFPAAALCMSEGTSSGDNTCALSGVSGDKYVFVIMKVGSSYYVSAKNLGQ
jgi:hypothetical protein